MSNPLKSFADSLSPRIEALEQRAAAVLELTERVRRALPDPEKNHVLAASYKGEDLVVLTDSAAWCTRIRYLERELTAALAAGGDQGFARVKVRVSPISQGA